MTLLAMRYYPRSIFFYGLVVVGLRSITGQDRAARWYILPAYILIAGFTALEIGWHIFKGQIQPALQGLTLFPEISVAACVLMVAFMVRALLKRKFTLLYILDAVIVLNMLGPAMIVVYRSTNWECDSMPRGQGVSFVRRDVQEHYGVAFAPDGKSVFYTSRGAKHRAVQCTPDRNTCRDIPFPMGVSYRLFTDTRRNRVLSMMYNEDPNHHGKPPPVAGGGFYYEMTSGDGSPVLRQVRIPVRFPVDAAFAPDGRSMVILDTRGGFALFDTVSGRTLMHQKSRRSTYRADWSDDGGSFFISSRNGRVREYSGGGKFTGREFRLPLSATSVAVDAGRKRLFVADPSLARVNVYDGKTLKRLDSWKAMYMVRELELAPLRRRLIAGSYRSGEVRVFDTGSGRVVQRFRFGRMLRQVAVSPDQKKAAAVSYCGLFVFDLK